MRSAKVTSLPILGQEEGLQALEVALIPRWLPRWPTEEEVPCQTCQEEADANAGKEAACRSYLALLAAELFQLHKEEQVPQASQVPLVQRACCHRF